MASRQPTGEDKRNTTACIRGNKQSPIDITDKGNLTRCGTNCELMFYYRKSKCYVIHTGNEIMLDYDVGSYVTYDRDNYELQSITFTTPGSHSINGQKYAAEMHLNHKSPNTQRMLIIAVFLEINDAPTKSNLFFKPLESRVPKKVGYDTVEIPETFEWNVFNALPTVKSFYSYEGSLTRTPCTEGVQWIIMSEVANCSLRFFDAINVINGGKGNIRQQQKVANRLITFNPNASERTNRNYGDSMMCLTEDEFREKCSRLAGNLESFVTEEQRRILIAVGCFFFICTFILMVMVGFHTGTIQAAYEKLREIIAGISDAVNPPSPANP